MNILITGGAGYIGSTVANYFLDKNHKVTIIDNLSRGYKFLIPKKAKFIKSDISNINKVSKLLNNNNFNLLIHLAGLTDVEESMLKPKKYVNNNFYKSKTFFDLCNKNNLKNIIFSSTAAVYKKSIKGFVSENSKTSPLSAYGKSKLLFENYLKNKKGINYIIFRYFNVAGTDYKFRTGPVHQKSLFKKLSQVIIDKNNIFKLYGKKYKTKDGTAIRDFIHVQDLARIHYSAAIFLLKNKKNLTINCGYGSGVSVLELLKIAQKIYKKKIKIKILPKRKGDLPKVISNSKKIKKFFKWKPKFNSIKRMLTDTVKWELKLNRKK